MTKTKKAFPLFFTVALFFVFMLPSIAQADLCVLKSGDYTLSSKYTISNPGGFSSDGSPETATPCTNADAADGSDNTISLHFPLGSDIEVDVVYEQNSSPTDQYGISYFTYSMFFDTTNMSIGDVYSGDCTPDPAGFFSDDACTFIGFPCCGDGLANDGTTPAIKNAQINFMSNNWPADPANFILDQVKIANTYSEGTDLYTFTFDETGAQRTEVSVVLEPGVSCGIIGRNDAGNCDDFGVIDQDILATKISIGTPSCFTGGPVGATVTCVGDPTSCAIDPLTASANVTLSYTNPTSCWDDAGATAPSTMCGTKGVEFMDLEGGTRSNQTSGTFMEITTVGTTPSYTLTGVDISGTCASSSNLTSPQTVTATAASECGCGEPPTVDLTTESDFLSEIFYEEIDINLDFELTDPNGTLPDSISNITLYYYLSSATSSVGIDVTSTLNSSGLFSAAIPGYVLESSVSIAFGVIVTDNDGLSAGYPANFNSDNYFSGIEIPGENIHSISSSPYPVISYPVSDQTVGNPVAIIGTAAHSEDYEGYILEYGSGASPSSWTQITATSTRVILYGEMGSWDTTSLSPGIYTIRQTILQSTGSITNTVTVTVDNIAPTATLTSPTDGATVSGNVSVTGTAVDSDTFDSYVLEYGVGEEPSSWIHISSSSSQVASGALGSWNTVMEDPANSISYTSRTTLPYSYSLRLTVKDMAGNIAQAQVAVTTDNTDDSGVLTSNDSEYPVGYPNWTSDGSKILYGKSDNYALGPWQIGCVLVYDGSADSFEINVDNFIIFDLDLSNDGSSLVSSANLDHTIITMLPDGSAAADLSVKGYDPEWSPDATEIAFSRGNSTTPYRIWIMDRDGTNLRQLTDGPGYDSQAAWSPDGSKVAFVRRAGSEQEGYSEIWVIDLLTLEETQLTNYDGINEDPAWSSDDRIFFTSDRSGNKDLYVMYASGTAQTQITYHPYDDMQPALSPDGTTLAFVSNRSGSNQVWTLPFSVTMDMSAPDAPVSAPKVVRKSGELSANVDWSEGINQNIAGLYLYRKAGDENYSRYGALKKAGDETNMDESNLTMNTTYCYKYSTINNTNNESQPSPEECIMFSSDNTPPSGFTAKGGKNSVVITWKNPLDANFEGVTIQRDTTSFPTSVTSGTNVYSGNAQSYIDTTVTNGTPHYYAIFSHDIYGNFSASSTDTQALATPGEWNLSLVDGWNLLTLPYTALESVPAELAALEEASIFSFSGAAFINSLDASFTGFQPGTAMWIYTAGDHESITINGGSISSSDPYIITLHEGWNLVGNPYADLVSWSDAAVKAKIGTGDSVVLSLGTDCVSGEIYDFRTDGTYLKQLANDGASLIPFKGYFVRAKTACTLEISKP